MNRFSNTAKGFTLVEVLVSMGIMAVLLPVLSILVSSQYLASVAKHKIQAAYVAQQLIETQRPIISTYFTPTPLLAGQSKVINGFVTIDTKGIYPANSCANSNLPCGSTSITVTPTVYTSTTGVKTTSTTVDHFVVKISWNEQITKSRVPMTETYAEDMANDSMLN